MSDSPKPSRLALSLGVIRERWLTRGHQRVDVESFRIDQRLRFDRLGLRYDDARQHSIAIRALVAPSRTDSRSSEHYELFAALLADGSPKQILEIGTDTGMFTEFLSLLAPAASIVTIDLDPRDPRYRNATSSALSTQEGPSETVLFGEARDERLNKCPNVRQITMDSLGLVAVAAEQPRSFDIVWVDGDHHYPTVAVDIAAALQLCRPSGVVVVDDVLPDPRGTSDWVGSEASDTIQKLVRAGLCRADFIHKRLKAKHLVRTSRRRFIAVLQPQLGLGLLSSKVNQER